MILAPLARVIPVTALPLPFIESYVSIVEASVVASIVVSLTSIDVKPSSLLNSLLLIAVDNVPSSARLLEPIPVTLVRFTATVVASFIEFKSEADTVASPVAMTIV